MLQWGHDWVVVEMVVCYTTYAAPGLLQWGHDWVVVEMRGPVPIRSLASVLQWGRDCVVVEIVAAGVGPDAEVDASMGPRLGSRGNRERGWAAQLEEDASMGPRLGSRGNADHQKT